jgi:uncharacterized damage-inducible protein DinB
MSATFVIQFDFHTRLFNNALKDISEYEANESMEHKVNNIKWLAGHLVGTRLLLKNYAGLKEDERFEVFGKGYDPVADYPSLQIIKTKWNEIAMPLSIALNNIPESHLEADGPSWLPVDEKNIRAFLAYLMHHEAYHLGQMGILRRQLGKDALIYR